MRRSVTKTDYKAEVGKVILEFLNEFKSAWKKRTKGKAFQPSADVSTCLAIYGPHGCGKTHLIRKHLSKFVELVPYHPWESNLPQLTMLSHRSNGKLRVLFLDAVDTWSKAECDRFVKKTRYKIGRRFVSKFCYPIICTTNDVWSKNFRILFSKQVTLMEMKPLLLKDIYNLVERHMRTLIKDSRDTRWYWLFQLIQMYGPNLNSILSQLEFEWSTEYVHATPKMEMYSLTFNVLRSKWFNRGAPKETMEVYEAKVTLDDKGDLQSELDKVKIEIENVKEDAGIHGNKKNHLFDYVDKLFTGRLTDADVAKMPKKVWQILEQKAIAVPGVDIEWPPPKAVRNISDYLKEYEKEEDDEEKAFLKGEIDKAKPKLIKYQGEVRRIAYLTALQQDLDCTKELDREYKMTTYAFESVGWRDAMVAGTLKVHYSPNGRLQRPTSCVPNLYKTVDEFFDQRRHPSVQDVNRTGCHWEEWQYRKTMGLMKAKNLDGETLKDVQDYVEAVLSRRDAMFTQYTDKVGKDGYLKTEVDPFIRDSKMRLMGQFASELKKSK